MVSGVEGPYNGALNLYRNANSCNDAVSLIQQVNFNKRTHASTIYKTIQAEKRLEQLERQNNNYQSKM